MLDQLFIKTYKLRYTFNMISYYTFYNNFKIKSLYNIYKNKPLLIIGNGPSINKTPLDDFCNVPSIGMNKINLLFPKVKWRPSIILCSNRLVIKQNREFFTKTQIPVFLSWKGRRAISYLNRRNLNYYLEKPTTSFSQDISNGLGSGGGTVSYACLQFAYYTGANPIILFGIDHSYEFKGVPSSIVKSEGKDVNHFDPNYFSDGVKWGLPNLSTMELAYRKAKLVFENEGRKIYDATINGKLDVFEKISVKDVYGLLNV